VPKPLQTFPIVSVGPTYGQNINAIGVGDVLSLFDTINRKKMECCRSVQTDCIYLSFRISPVTKQVASSNISSRFSLNRHYFLFHKQFYFNLKNLCYIHKIFFCSFKNIFDVQLMDLIHHTLVSKSTLFEMSTMN
jgi:hypothetical protein